MKPTIRRVPPLLAALLTAALLGGCGARGHVFEPTGTTPAAGAAENARPTGPAAKTHPLILPRARYGTTSAGRQLAPADDPCDIPKLLDQAVQAHLLTPYTHTVPAQPLQPPRPPQTPRAAAAAPPGGMDAPAPPEAPRLDMEITDLLGDTGGLHGGPRVVQVRGTLHRPGAAPVHFQAHRRAFIYFGLPRGACSMVGNLSYALGADIARWLQHPVDGQELGSPEP